MFHAGPTVSAYQCLAQGLATQVLVVVQIFTTGSSTSLTRPRCYLWLSPQALAVEDKTPSGPPSDDCKFQPMPGRSFACTI